MKALGFVALIVATGSAITFPLATYAISLTLLGLPHILFELRYVDRRFSKRLPASLVTALISLGALLVALRAMFLTHILPAGWQAPIELVLLALFAAAVLPLVRRASLHTAALGIGVVLLGGLALWQPISTLAVFALVHNATPIGFLVEAAPAERRLVTVVSTTAIYIGVPLLVALGAGDVLLAALGATWHDGAHLLSTGPLAAHLFVYVPPFVPDAWARQLFTAAVVAQLLHYHATIVLMPRLSVQNGDGGGVLRWPAALPFVALVAAVTVGLSLVFAWSFRDGRALYGVPAAFHAWIEVPLLIAAFTALPPRTTTAPPRS